MVVTALYRGRGQGSGVPIEARFYAVYTLRDGRVVRVDEFTDRAEALEAAGLSEDGQKPSFALRNRRSLVFESSRAR